MIPRASRDVLRAPFAILPVGATSAIHLLLATRGLRAIGDGFVSLLLPVDLLVLGHGAFETGVIATATLAGSALLTLLVGPLRASGLGAGAVDRRRPVDGAGGGSPSPHPELLAPFCSSPSSARSIRLRAMSVSSCRWSRHSLTAW
jgi:hypothetical protein